MGVIEHQSKEADQEHNCLGDKHCGHASAQPMERACLPELPLVVVVLRTTPVIGWAWESSCGCRHVELGPSTEAVELGPQELEVVELAALMSARAAIGPFRCYRADKVANPELLTAPDGPLDGCALMDEPDWPARAAYKDIRRRLCAATARRTGRWAKKSAVGLYAAQGTPQDEVQCWLQGLPMGTQQAGARLQEPLGASAEQDIALHWPSTQAPDCHQPSASQHWTYIATDASCSPGAAAGAWCWLTEDGRRDLMVTGSTSVAHMELEAIAQALEAVSASHVVVFTDYQPAARRFQATGTGSGQQWATKEMDATWERIIQAASGRTVLLHWVRAHQQGNALPRVLNRRADMAVRAALRTAVASGGRAKARPEEAQLYL